MWLSSFCKITGDNRSLLKPEFLPPTWLTGRGFDHPGFCGRECSLKISMDKPLATSRRATYAAISKGEPIRIYKLKASGEEHNLGNGLLGNLTTVRAPWKSALNSIVVHPISSQLYGRACGQGLAGKRPGCLGL